MGGLVPATPALANELPHGWSVQQREGGGALYQIQVGAETDLQEKGWAPLLRRLAAFIPTHFLP